MAGVVAIHLAGIAKRDTSPYEGHFGDLVNCISRCAVPLLFMLSGYLLLGKEEPVGEFLQKRLKRILFPMLFWTAFFVLWDAAFFGKGLDRKTLFWQFATLDYKHHLWFLYAIFGAYFMVPILRVLVCKADTKLIDYTAMVLLVGPAITTLCYAYIGWGSWHSPQGQAPFYDMFTYLGFMVLPWTSIMNGKRLSWPLSLTLYAAITSLMIFGKHCLGEGGRASTLFDNYSSPFLILQTIPAFYILGHLSRTFEKREKQYIWTKISDNSLGIYLVHPLVIDLIAFLLPDTLHHGGLWMIGSWIFVFTLSYGMVWCLQLSRFTSWTLGELRPNTASPINAKNGMPQNIRCQ